jgi:serine/threonine-protein kinase
MNTPSLINASFGNHVLRVLLGAGGVAEVYRAEHRDDGQAVAVKVLRPERQADRAHFKAFGDEYTRMQHLSHPSIPAVKRMGEVMGRAAFSMDFVPGDTLATMVAKSRSFAAASCLRQLAEVVAYLHTEGLIHNDIKLENAILRPDGRVILIDYGNVRDVSGTNIITRMFTRKPTQVFGTATYLAPELIEGRRPTMTSDVYALGVCAFILLSGSPPFDATRQSGRLRANAVQTPPTIRDRVPQLSTSAAQAIDHALAKNPEDRPQTAHSFLQALKSVSSVKPATSNT